MPRHRYSVPPPKEAKLFRNNRSQAVRIPVEFELPGEKVLISRDGDRLIIEPVRKPGLVALLAQWAIGLFAGVMGTLCAFLDLEWNEQFIAHVEPRSTSMPRKRLPISSELLERCHDLPTRLDAAGDAASERLASALTVSG